MASDSDR